MKYLERRVIHAILLLIGVSVFCFLFSDLAPGSFFDEMKLNPQISSETVAALRSQYGLDKPLPVRYARWVESVLHGEWGYSFAYNSLSQKPTRGTSAQYAASNHFGNAAFVADCRAPWSLDFQPPRQMV